MKIHRFYYPELVDSNELAIENTAILHQWTNVLRFHPGQKLVLFDGRSQEGLFELQEITKDVARIVKLSTQKRNIPKTETYLFWSVLKKDKNDWILQKCTELGVSFFIPLTTERSEKKNLNMDRSKKIIIEAAEQSGRGDMPNIAEPVSLAEALKHYKKDVSLFICEQGAGSVSPSKKTPNGVIVGPEGGWSASEKQLFENEGLMQIGLSNFTLRAETACIIAVAQLQ